MSARIRIRLSKLSRSDDHYAPADPNRSDCGPFSRRCRWRRASCERWYSPNDPFVASQRVERDGRRRKPGERGLASPGDRRTMDPYCQRRTGTPADGRPGRLPDVVRHPGWQGSPSARGSAEARHSHYRSQLSDHHRGTAPSSRRARLAEYQRTDQAQRSRVLGPQQSLSVA